MQPRPRIVPIAMFVLVQFIPSAARDHRSSRHERKFMAIAPVMSRFARHKLLLAVAFTFRLCEFAVVSMIKPYWVDRGYSATEIGTITGIVGLSVSIVGTIAGGWVVARAGIWRGLLWLGIAQNASNLGYALVATAGAGKWAIYAAAIVENLGSTGIGRGIAIPHCRSLVVNKLRVAFGRKSRGVDFKAIDEKPVNFFFLIVAPPLEVSNQYLPVLGKIAQFSKEPDVPQRLLGLTEPQQFMALLEEKGV